MNFKQAYEKASVGQKIFLASDKNSVWYVKGYCGKLYYTNGASGCLVDLEQQMKYSSSWWDSWEVENDIP